MKELLIDFIDYPQGKVVVVTLNRPKRGNAMTSQMTRELFSTLEKVEKEKSVRALFLTGSGKYFCTGMDLQRASNSEMSSDAGQDPVPEFQKMFTKVANLKIPTVCILNGPALGGGVGLFFACDIRISTSKDNYVCLAECKRGLVPALISPWIVAELGKSMAMEMMVGGYRVYATKLYTMGILSLIIGVTQPLSIPTDESISINNTKEAIDYYSEMLTSSAPVASTMIKQLVRRIGVEAEGWDAKLSYVRDLFPKMMANEEATYGMMSFLQKQKPNWAEFHQSKL